MCLASSNSHLAESSASAMSITPMALCTSSVSPIQELPDELLEEIFLYHMPPDEDQTLFVRNDCWTLLNVCQSWRRVTTQCPLLRRHIEVPVRALAARCSDPVALLSLVIARAKTMDLFIMFDTSGVEDDAGNVLCELALTLLKVLMERSTQWRIICFLGLNTPCMHALDGIQGRLPRLTDLYVNPHIEAQLELTGFTLAPLLEAVRLTYAPKFQMVQVVGCIPMQSQLTAFVVRGARYDSSLVDLLRNCRRLKVLRMRFLRRSPPVDERVASRITRLDLPEFFSDLTLVRLPQLRMLRVGDIDAISLETILPSVLDLLKHSRCPLVSFCLVNSDLDGLVAVLELVPHLRHLSIEFGNFLPDDADFASDVGQALSALMTDLEKANLVPKLQRLMLILKMPREGLTTELTFFRQEGVTAMLRRRNEQSQLKAHCRFTFEEVSITEHGWLELEVEVD